MREWIVLGAALALCACGPEQSAEERAAAEQNVTAQVVATNDLTAIDAATGADADMAADIGFMPEIENQADGNEAVPPAARTRDSANDTVRPRSPARDRPAPDAPDSTDADEPEANSL